MQSRVNLINIYRIQLSFGRVCVYVCTTHRRRKSSRRGRNCQDGKNGKDYSRSIDWLIWSNRKLLPTATGTNGSFLTLLASVWPFFCYRMLSNNSVALAWPYNGELRSWQLVVKSTLIFYAIRLTHVSPKFHKFLINELYIYMHTD